MVALLQGRLTWSATGCRVAAGLISRPQRNLGDTFGSRWRGSKKKLWEHQEGLAAEARSEGYAAQTQPEEAASTSAATSAAQEQTKGRRGKTKAKKPPEDDHQIDLF